MPDEARLIFAFALAVATALATTPVAIAVAARTGFHDRPIGYKGHARPTPYLGGAAVVIAFLLAGFTAGGELARLSPIVACTFAVWCLGTTDDKVNLSPLLRLAVEFGVASALWAAGPRLVCHGLRAAGSVSLDLLGRRTRQRLQPDGQHGWRCGHRGRRHHDGHGCPGLHPGRPGAGHPLRRDVRRVPRLPPLQPGGPGADLPRRRGQPHDRVPRGRHDHGPAG